jgi:hypothetical protein
MRSGFAVPKGKGTPLQFGQVLVWVLALASLGAGVIHCSASPDHASLPLHAAFFVAVGTAQILWAPLILRRFSRRWLYLGAAGNLALAAIWLASRTTGIGFVPGAERVEPVGFKDTVTVLLEVVVVAGVGWWTLLPGRERRLASGRLAIATMGAAVGLIMVAGVTAPSHEHDESTGEFAANHPHGGALRDDHGDQAAGAHPVHADPGSGGHAEDHALAPGHALGDSPLQHHADHQRAAAVRHAAHGHAGGHSAEDAPSHEHPSGPADEGHRHEAGSSSPGDEAHDHQNDDHGEDGKGGHDHGGGGSTDPVTALIDEAGKLLGL